MLEKLRKLLTSETSTNIKAAIASVDLDALRADLASAEASRQQLLLTADDKKILAAEADITAKRLSLERGTAALAALEEKLAAASAKEFDAQFEKDRAAVVTKCETVTKELASKLVPAVNEIARLGDLVRDATTARKAIYGRMCADISQTTVAGRSTEVPSPLREWNREGLPE